MSDLFPSRRYVQERNGFLERKRGANPIRTDMNASLPPGINPDPQKQKASDIQDYTPPSSDSSTTTNTDLITSLTKSLALHASEHYPSSVSAVVPPNPSSPSSSTISADSNGSNAITLLLVSSKYSPSNFWNGRLRTIYTFHPTTSTLRGTLKCDVHYYEDGNVRLTTTKTLPESKVSASPTGGGLTGNGSGGGSGADIIRDIAKVERKWQEELNKGFAVLSEGSFKGLRRQLPVTRQKMEWEKVGGLRVGREIGGLPVR